MGSILDAVILHHVCIVLGVLWALNSFNCCHPVAYFIALLYLYMIHEVYVMKLTKKLQFEEKRESNQRRVLSDTETVRWLNHAIEKMWSLCMEEIVSQKILLPMIPWFLHKFKPWTVKDAEVQQLYLGRSPPMFTGMRILPKSCDDDHLVMELGMNFRTADDMSSVLGVKLRKRLGFGMPVKLHLLGLHVEGKVLVGVKFLRKWPFISRLRVCFAGPPYFQMTVKPIFTHGLDVTVLPGIAGWIDNLLGLVFEQTLVEPNLLVVDVVKFVSPEPENWFSVDAKEPIAHAIVEILEAVDMNPSDLNGLADPYVKGQVGHYRFRTKIQKKTLAPKWMEEFKIPIVTWESQNMLSIQVRDKDHIFDDMMGDCHVNINDFRDGQRYDLWLPLKNIKMGRLHLAVTVCEVTAKGAELSNDAEGLDCEDKSVSFATDSVKKGSFSSRTSEKSPKVADEFEPVDVAGQQETGIWIHRPGSEVVQVSELRKGKARSLDYRVDGVESIQNSKDVNLSTGQNDDCSTDESVDAAKPQSNNPVRKGLRKIGSVFYRNPKTEDKSNGPDEQEPSPRYNIGELHSKKIGVKFTLDDTISPSSEKTPKGEESSPEANVAESPSQGLVKDKAKSILKQAGKSARGLKNALSRKASRRWKSETGSSPTEKSSVLDPDSSDDEKCSLSVDIPVVATASIGPDSAVSSADSTSGYSSLKIKELIIPKTTLSAEPLSSSGNTIQIGSTNIENGTTKVHKESPRSPI